MESVQQEDGRDVGILLTATLRLERGMCSALALWDGGVRGGSGNLTEVEWSWSASG